MPVETPALPVIAGPVQPGLVAAYADKAARTPGAATHEPLGVTVATFIGTLILSWLVEDGTTGVTDWFLWACVAAGVVGVPTLLVLTWVGKLR